MNVEEYLNQLNESQREAVVYNEGPSLVVAGAGSGKTRVLTYKIAYLLQLGLPPYSILALTFTNKAAREMKERIAAITGDQTARRLWMGTFHSIFSRILRNEAEHIGYPSNFTIYDATDSKSLLKSIIKEMQLDDKVYRLGMVQSRISNAKNSLITYTAYEQNKELVESDMNAKVPLLRKSTNVARAVACKRERWISTTCCCKPISCSGIIRPSWRNTGTSSGMYWWMSIKIRTSPNT